MTHKTLTTIAITAAALVAFFVAFPVVVGVLLYVSRIVGLWWIGSIGHWWSYWLSL